MVSAAGAAQTDPRKERARETRRRMVHAATKLFAERGYANTPMTAIAVEAGVAVQTLYFTFHNKNALLMEAYDYAVTADKPDEWPRHDWMAALAAEPDPRKALEMQADLNLEVYQRIGGLLRAVQALMGDPEIAAFVAQREGLRVKGFGRFIDMISAKSGGLRPGVSRQEAIDTLLLVHGPGAMDFLLRERGWTPRKWRDWSVRVLVATLLTAPEPSAEILT
ncbi:MAG: TetR/AcrR family transcriptional regulator [Candidatus Dormibacteraeota bacterium]|nr:TetR/AcrR family transcriptional regulator [Candidatus Dormibacteraeota bacterium]